MARQLIDWHTHCWLPEHRSKEDAALWKLRGVLGTGKADPQAHQSAVEDAGIERFVVVAIPKRGGMHTASVTCRAPVRIDLMYVYR